MSLASFNRWLESVPRTGDFLQVSATRPFAHAEEMYDISRGVTTPRPEEGLGLCALLQRLQVPLEGPAIEIGCGTGHLTTGLVQGYPGPAVVVTDPSATFLRLTRDRIGSEGAGKSPIYYGILNGDDLGLLPRDMFSLVTLRSTLHHIFDVPAFIAACARTLRTGGALAMSAEPCESGYVLMGTVALSIPAILQNAGVEMKPEWSRNLQLFCDTMKFYCRRDVDKSAAEDKHLFRVHELAATGAKHGMRLEYFPNANFPHFYPPLEGTRPKVRFETFILGYLRFSMGFEPALVELIGTHLQPHFRYLDECYSGHQGPLFTGTFVFIKDR